MAAYSKDTLHNSQDVTINGGVINMVEGDYYYHTYNNDGEQGLQTLSKTISTSALHDSADRDPPPRCHPRTRIAVLKEITSWIEGSSSSPSLPLPSTSTSASFSPSSTDKDEGLTSSKRILWLKGPLGTGKSAISQSVAELYHKSHLNSDSNRIWDNNTSKIQSGYAHVYFGGSFFFKAKSDREMANHLFTTLAFQLALNVPGIREHVNRIMIMDPTLGSKEVGKQFQELIIRPLQAQAQANPETSFIPFVIIDGLNECTDRSVQKRIIDLIVDGLITHNINLRFIITSRSEEHIKNIFNSPKVRRITRQIALDGKFNPDHDIELYLRDQFADIIEKQRDKGMITPDGWPSEKDIKELTKKSSGQFLYAVTVVGFVKTPDSVEFPDERLGVVLSPKPIHGLGLLNYSNNNAGDVFTPVNQLYTQILQTSPSRDLKDILSLLLVFHCPQPLSVYEEILGKPYIDRPGRLKMVLQPLHSVIKVPDENDYDLEKERRRYERRAEYDQTKGLRLHHTSLREFLVDKKRCPDEFIVDVQKAHGMLVKRGLGLMMKWIERPWRPEEQSKPPHRETLGYLKYHICNHLKQCSEVDRQSIIEELQKRQIHFPQPLPTRVNDQESWDHAFHALYSLLTTLAKIISLKDDNDITFKAKFLEPDIFHSEHAHWAQEHVLQITDISSMAKEDPLFTIYLKYRDILDQFYKYFLSMSDHNTNVFGFLSKFPGITAQKHVVPIERGPLEDIFFDNDEGHVPADSPVSNSNSTSNLANNSIAISLYNTRNFVHRWYTKLGPGQELPFGKSRIDGVGLQAEEERQREVILLNPHFNGFLRDEQRAGAFFQDPEILYVNDLCRTIQMVWKPAWLMRKRQPTGLIYLDGVFKACFENIKIKPECVYAKDHPVIKLLDMLHAIKYDYTVLCEIPVTNVRAIWSVTRRLLDWLEEQSVFFKNQPSSRSREYRKHFLSISINIYSQILEIDGKNALSTRQPFADLLRVPVSQSSSPMISISLISEEEEAISRDKAKSIEGDLQISETILSLHGMRNSLMSFITRPKRAKHLYILKERYHTLLAEVCLRYCDPDMSNITGDWRKVPAYCEWRFHLDKAQPTPQLVAILGSIRPGAWLAEGLPSSDRKAKIKSIHSIITWLENRAKTPADSETMQKWHKALMTLKRFNKLKSVSRLDTSWASSVSSSRPSPTSASSSAFTHTSIEPEGSIDGMSSSFIDESGFLSVTASASATSL